MAREVEVGSCSGGVDETGTDGEAAVADGGYGKAARGRRAGRGGWRG